MRCIHCGAYLEPTDKFCPACGNAAITENQAPVIGAVLPDIAIRVSPETVAPVVNAESLAPASTGTRFLHFIIDYISYLLFASIAGLIFGIVGLYEALNIENMNDQLLGIIIFVLFYGFFEGLWRRTPGKWLTKTKVVSYTGDEPSFGQIIGRTLLRFIPFEPLSVFGNKSVMWHDSFSRTLVVPARYTVEQIQQLVAELNSKNQIGASPQKPWHDRIATIVFWVLVGVIGLAVIALAIAYYTGNLE